jgi:hypothetical protein
VTSRLCTVEILEHKLAKNEAVRAVLINDQVALLQIDKSRNSIDGVWEGERDIYLGDVA